MGWVRVGARVRTSLVVGTLMETVDMPAGVLGPTSMPEGGTEPEWLRPPSPGCAP